MKAKIEALERSFVKRGESVVPSRLERVLEALEENHRPQVITCRDEEMRKIRDFIETGMRALGSLETMYISGVPGMGKTLCVQEVIKEFQLSNPEIRYLFVNAVTLRHPRDIFKDMLYQISRKVEDPMVALSTLNFIFSKPQKTFTLLLIDEIDCLITKSQDELYSIFEWNKIKNSHFIIIGISNSIDLPETLLPKINSRIGMSRLVFTPYTSKQIEKIVMERIGSFDIFEPQAIEYICKRIAMCSTDVRKILQIIREAVTRSFLEQKEGKNARVPLARLIEVHEDNLEEAFEGIFSAFSFGYKKILLVLANYFKTEVRSCTFREVCNLCSGLDISNDTIQSILFDLSDMRLVKIVFRTKDTDGRYDQSYPLILKHLSEGHLTLLTKSETILTYIMKDPLSKDLLRFIK